MKLLAIETSSRRGSVALGVGDRILERTMATPREQTDRVLAFVDGLLGEAGLSLAALDAVVYGRGPGSFTGLRIAAAVAQGLAFSSGRPIVAVSSLAALAQHAFAVFGAERALCCVDARMGEVYSACYSSTGGLPAADGDEAIGPPSGVAAPGAPFVAVGDGFDVYRDVLAEPLREAAGVDAGLVPRARDLLPLAAADVAAARFVPVELAVPVYLREADAWR